MYGFDHVLPKLIEGKIARRQSWKFGQYSAGLGLVTQLNQCIFCTIGADGESASTYHLTPDDLLAKDWYWASPPTLRETSTLVLGAVRPTT